MFQKIISKEKRLVNHRTFGIKARDFGLEEVGEALEGAVGSSAVLVAVDQVVEGPAAGGKKTIDFSAKSSTISPYSVLIREPFSPVGRSVKS